LLILAISSCAANAATANLRIEGSTETIFNGQVSAGSASVPVSGGDCSAPPATSVAKSGATPITALTAWATLTGSSYNTSYEGAFVCRIGDLTGNDSPFWLMKINNKKRDGSTTLNGSSPVSDGDSVLWYFTDSDKRPTLSLDLPAAAQKGEPVKGTVSSFDGNNGDAKSTPSGVVVAGGGASGTSGSGGSVTLNFPAAGRFLVAATKSGSVRASTWITVTTDPVPDSSTTTTGTGVSDKQKRVLARRKCLRSYKWHRYSPRYKRCVAKANRIGKSK
jgi:hypothetical protein